MLFESRNIIFRRVLEQQILFNPKHFNNEFAINTPIINRKGGRGSIATLSWKGMRVWLFLLLFCAIDFNNSNPNAYWSKRSSFWSKRSSFWSKRSEDSRTISWSNRRKPATFIMFSNILIRHLDKHLLKRLQEIT